MNNCEPQLGCATTEELLGELRARISVSRGEDDDLVRIIHYVIDNLVLDELKYRTVNS